jgi:AhpD family alkylhydroperoxidase
MSHVETPPDRRFPWYVRLIFLLQRRRYGRELEPARLWGRVPRAFLAMSAMYGVLDRKSSPIDPALRSLVQVRVSQVNGCGFCIDINSASGLKRGVDQDKLAALPRFAESSAFTGREKAALRYAEAVTDSNRRTDAALFHELRRHFDDDEIVELTALIAYQNMSSKFNAALGVPAQGFCAVPGAPSRRADASEMDRTH